MAEDPNFLIVLRGYDRDEVRELTRRGNQALASGDPAERAAVAEQLRRPQLTVRLRGYDRQQVAEHFGQLAARLAS
ncbi:hypothetical protein ACN27G_11725 [Plantactinospora sp. WMMB334]|uniref:hypothetical protein n=1 Tax=Plantactinospora sp. WMMB334 TaxID=3404119 RepID=UPI003B9244A7